MWMKIVHGLSFALQSEVCSGAELSKMPWDATDTPWDSARLQQSMYHALLPALSLLLAWLARLGWVLTTWSNWSNELPLNYVVNYVMNSVWTNAALHSDGDGMTQTTFNCSEKICVKKRTPKKEIQHHQANQTTTSNTSLRMYNTSFSSKLDLLGVPGLRLGRSCLQVSYSTWWVIPSSLERWSCHVLSWL